MLVLSARDAAWHPFLLLSYARLHTTGAHQDQAAQIVRFYSAIPILQMHYCTFVIIGPEGNPNPFAAVVLAHLKTLETRRQPAERCQWKLRVVKGLFERGLTAEQVRQLFRLIDWLMDLPPELARQFADQLYHFEEERKMPYITSVERLAREKGRAEGIQEEIREGIELALELKFGADGLALMPLVRQANKPELLRTVRQTLRTAETLEPIRALLSQTG
jgi:hypothetical protein